MDLSVLLSKALDEKLPALLNKALDEKLPALVNKALEEKLPAHPMHNEGHFEPDNGTKLPEKVEESLDKYNQVANNKDDVESQVPNNKPHVSWGLLQCMYYLLLFG